MSKNIEIQKTKNKFLITIIVLVIVFIIFFVILINPDIIPFINKKEKAEKYIEKAGTYLSAQKPGSKQNVILQNQARQELDKALELDPENPNALLLRASISINIGKYEEGFEIIDKLLKINPNNIDAYYYRASGNMQKGNNNEAIKDFSKIIEIDPKYTDAYFYRGQIYYLEKDFKSAEKDFTKVVQLKPELPQGYSARGLVRLELGQKDSGCVDLKRAKYLGQQGQANLDSLMKIQCK